MIDWTEKLEAFSLYSIAIYSSIISFPIFPEHIWLKVGTVQVACHRI